MKKLIILSLILLLTASLFAQTKQEIYCNPNIVWAGIVELDFVVDADTNTNWKTYEISDLHHLFKQKIGEDNPEKTLNEMIISDADIIDFYNYDSLKYKIHYQELDIRNWAVEPDTYGDDWERIPASEFNVFRLKCFFYYDKSTQDFKIVPQAVAVMHPTYDVPELVFSYNILGWLPVEHLTEYIKINDENLIFNFQFQRDIPFQNVKVFKQEWTTEETINNFMETIRQKAETIQLYEPYKDSLMDSEEIKLLGLDEIYGLRFDTYEETQEYVPWDAEEYKAIRFSMNWLWNEKTKSLSILITDFAPLIQVQSDFEEVPGTRLMFRKKY